MRKQFINSRELLLTVDTFKGGSYLGESALLGTVYETAKEALDKHNDDGITRFIRFDLDALHGEDVTEQMAEAWLDDFEHSPDDEHLLPEYVRNSEAWEQWCEVYHTTNGLFTQRSHGTINHRQQGIGR